MKFLGPPKNESKSCITHTIDGSDYALKQNSSGDRIKNGPKIAVRMRRSEDVQLLIKLPAWDVVHGAGKGRPNLNYANQEKSYWRFRKQKTSRSFYLSNFFCRHAK